MSSALRVFHLPLLLSLLCSDVLIATLALLALTRRWTWMIPRMIRLDDEIKRNISSSYSEPASSAPGLQRSRLQPALVTLPFVLYADWDPDRSYAEQLLLSCIYYIME